MLIFLLEEKYLIRPKYSLDFKSFSKINQLDFNALSKTSCFVLCYIKAYLLVYVEYFWEEKNKLLAKKNLLN